MDINYTAIAAAQELVKGGHAIVLDSNGVIAIIFSGFILFLMMYALVFNYAYRRGIKYVWFNGIDHTKKEHYVLYEKYKLKQKGIDLSD
jgi:hypothetical protein